MRLLDPCLLKNGEGSQQKGNKNSVEAKKARHAQ
jgi:hypothetical protein